MVNGGIESIKIPLLTFDLAKKIFDILPRQ